ncbi:MAG TPA: flavin reductase family protein [Gemmatimonadaceae bacterium]|nr:flavin reductase family protein [Gemmatimonadaceae bacterium]
MIDAETFRAVLGRFASGVTILTARDDAGLDHGMTASAVCSLSLDPTLVLVCIDHDASMHPLMLEHPSFGINILSSDQEAYSRRFAAEEDDRFEGIAFHRGHNGVVLLEDALAHMECHVVRHHDAGDHTIFIAEVDRAEPAAADGRPLLYYRGGYAQLER